RSFIQRTHNKIVNILVYDKHSENFVSMMHRINPDSRLNVYQVDEFDVVTVLKLREKITQGEWVFIAGDRIPVTGHQRTTSINFLGRKAQLPIGPYYLAHALACPVNLIFSYRHNMANTQKIKLEVVRFSEKIFLPRKSRDADLLDYAQQFAIEIEKQCIHAPFQWFNFYDFWATIKPTPSNIR
ncbi:MAG: acyltransferase, partial [Gammaproteobacteria bacterium]|nr:acyltransferase [Gammaproteobacteria bacterium]